MKKRVILRILAVCLAIGLLPTAALVMGAVPAAAAAVDETYKSWDQGDARWGWMDMGGGNSMADIGCYVTAVAKLLVHARQQDQSGFTPKECLEGMLAHGMLDAGGSVYYGNFNNSFLPTYGPELEKVYTDPEDMGKDAAIRAISDDINNGYYVIVMVSSRWGRSTHYLAVDYVGDDIYVMDNGGVIALYRDGPSRGYSIIKDRVRFLYHGAYDYPAIGSGTTTNGGTETGGENGTTKTQYRYHRYENGDGSDYFVCANLGKLYYPTMKLVYSDWVDTPYPEVKKGYANYLEHPRQPGCAGAGCLATDPFEVHRHVAPDGKVWYYEETRQVTVGEAKPDCANGHTWGEWVIVTEASCGVEGQRQRVCSVCGEKESEVIPALEHDYQPTEEADRTVYTCVNCGDSYTEDRTTGMDAFRDRAAYTTGMFVDVRSADWFEGNVRAACRLGLMNGTGNGAFSPLNNVTIAEAVTMAARIHRLYHEGTDEFERYDGGNWYDPYVNYAREQGIIYENYAYHRPATREEFCHILSAALPQEELTARAKKVDFEDREEMIYSWETALLQRAGIINGIEVDGKLYFKPGNAITRAEAAAVITRIARPALRMR